MTENHLERLGARPEREVMQRERHRTTHEKLLRVQKPPSARRNAPLRRGGIKTDGKSRGGGYCGTVHDRYRRAVPPVLLLLPKVLAGAA